MLVRAVLVCVVVLVTADPADKAKDGEKEKVNTRFGSLAGAFAGSISGLGQGHHSQGGRFPSHGSHSSLGGRYPSQGGHSSHGGRFPSQGGHHGHGSHSGQGSHVGVFPGQGGHHGHGSHSGHGNQGGVFPGIGIGVGGRPPGHGGSHGGSTACKYWCRTNTNQYYCCPSGSGSKPGRCPPVRPVCPFDVRVGPPQHCYGDDYKCSGSNKCCYDVCIGDKVCKPSDNIYG